MELKKTTYNFDNDGRLEILYPKRLRRIRITQYLDFSIPLGYNFKLIFKINLPIFNVLLSMLSQFSASDRKCENKNYLKSI
jgi:hypothetical protein